MITDPLFQPASKAPKKLNKLINYAIVKARNHNSHGKQSVYAIAIDSKGLILAEAGNRYKAEHPTQGQQVNIWNVYNRNKFSNTKEGHYIPDSTHAEQFLIERLKRVPKEKRAGVTIIVARSTTKLTGTNAKPCIVCTNSLLRIQKRLDIKRVFYTTSE
ncbi:MAG: hypothetical protein M0R77_00345 [Gammaproteobacteria bacterium]|nr:hypothetical protein [Acholeplasmataceae bacterium]MCK9529003.1 hypothetical protein [Gammaproteobacteria bacterium]